MPLHLSWARGRRQDGPGCGPCSPGRSTQLPEEPFKSMQDLIDEVAAARTGLAPEVITTVECAVASHKDDPIDAKGSAALAAAKKAGGDGAIAFAAAEIALHACELRRGRKFHIEALVCESEPYAFALR